MSERPSHPLHMNTNEHHPHKNHPDEGWVKWPVQINDLIVLKVPKATRSFSIILLIKGDVCDF